MQAFLPLCTLHWLHVSILCDVARIVLTRVLFRVFVCVVLPQLELKPNCGSDRAWVWSTPADFADEEPKPELLAIRFANAESKTVDTGFCFCVFC
jgi:RanBP1 domain